DRADLRPPLLGRGLDERLGLVRRDVPPDNAVRLAPKVPALLADPVALGAPLDKMPVPSVVLLALAMRDVDAGLHGVRRAPAAARDDRAAQYAFVLRRGLAHVVADAGRDL